MTTPHFLSFLDTRLTAAQAQQLATRWALATALFLVIIKAFGYFASDSLSLLSSLLDSASDIVASLGTYIGVRTALRPADADHRFGHGKAEAMAALGTAAFVLGSAFLLFIEAVSRLNSSHVISQSGLAIGIMIISMLLTALLLSVQRYAVRRSGSAAIKADSVHYAADFAANGAVIAALVLTFYTGQSWIDAAFGIAVSLWLLWQIIPVAREAVDMLMDKELPEAQRAQILALAVHPLVKGVHDLRTRQSGADIFIELHLEFEPELSLRKAHGAGAQIEAILRAAFPKADVIIHFDPEGVEEPRLDDNISS